MQLLSHYRWLCNLTQEGQHVLLAEDGDVLQLQDGQTSKQGVVACKMIAIDGNRYLPLDKTTLRERKDMMYSGLLLISRYRARDGNRFDVTTNGMVEESPGRIVEIVRKNLSRLALSDNQSDQEQAGLIYTEIKRLIRKIFQGKPLIRVVINGRIVR